MTDNLSAVVVIGVAAGIALWLIRRAMSKDRNTGTPDGLATYGPHELEAYVRNHIVEIAGYQFPDNPGLQWAVHGFQYREDINPASAEVAPRPDEVGYSRFKFALLMSGSGPPRPLATCCLESGNYTLLSTSRYAPKDVPRRLDWVTGQAWFTGKNKRSGMKTPATYLQP